MKTVRSPQEAQARIDSKVAEAIELDRTIKDLTDRLKELKAEFVLAAAGKDLDIQATDGNVVHVCFPDPSLIRGGFFFLGDQAVIIQDKKQVKLGPIRDLAGEHFGKLFAQFYKPAKAFRELTRVLLPEKRAEKLIELCEEESSPRVTFEIKTSATASPARFDRAA